MQRLIKHTIFLTGFMGTGKTTVGKSLAGLLGCPFVDLDDLIVQREGRPIAEIFATNGELYFRDCETSLLKELHHDQSAIYATGGGLVVRDENRRHMANLGKVVYLKASWSVLKHRLQQSSARPLVNSAKDWGKVKDLLFQRQIYYEQADLIIETNGLTPVQVAQKIISEFTL